jgi:malonyl-CoA decarboxylase
VPKRPYSEGSRWNGGCYSERRVVISMDNLENYRSLSLPERGALFDRWVLDEESDRRRRFAGLMSEGGGFPALVQARADLLTGLDANPTWSVVDADLTHILKSAVADAPLEFRRIERSASTSLLEKLIEYEAVHEIHNWNEFWRRLESDRRCFAFFHPDWPDEPLIFTEVALTRGLSANVQQLLDPGSPVLETEWSDAALFYSITNCQPGLRGFAFGNALLTRAIETLRTDLPQLTTFATLSPIPGFRSWLSALAVSAKPPDEIRELMVALEQPRWFDDHRVCARLKTQLMPLCAYYLLYAKRGADPADSVARFHLANGALLRRVNWLSDVSQTGLRRSAGLTASYLYSPDGLARSRDAYAVTRRVRASRPLRRAAKHVELVA